MIKVQPAYSRIEKSESADRITLTMPARGLLSGGTVILLFSILWLGVSGWIWTTTELFR
jgi:hypothetical protein